MIHHIKFNEALLAIIISHAFQEEGIHFVTEEHHSQQLAYMRHPQGKVIQPHIHNPVKRQVAFTHEVLFIKRGKLRVDFYDDDRNYLESWELIRGDTILLMTGGHGFEVLEDLEMIEVKQGPYAGDKDKTRFESPVKERLIIRNKE